MLRFALLVVILCLCHTLAFAQAEGSALSETAEAAELFPNSFAGVKGPQIDPISATPKRLFALEFGLLELKASYFERRLEGNELFRIEGDPAETTWGKYAELFAVSSQLDGKLVGEAQAAYSTLGSPASSDQLPMLTSWRVHGRWGKTGYGLSYRSSDRGYVSPGGVTIEHARDESQIWAEYDLSLFRLRGAVGEMREEDSETHQLTLTRSTATSFYVNKSSWSAALSSSYSTIANYEHLQQKTLAFTNGLSFAYRFTPLFTFEPNVSFKQEWAPITRLKTDTSSAGFGMAYTASRDVQLIGRAYYARDLSDDPLRGGAIVNAATGFNWKLGKSFLGQQSVSLHLEYKNESRLPTPEQANLLGTMRFRILGF